MLVCGLGISDKKSLPNFIMRFAMAAIIMSKFLVFGFWLTETKVGPGLKIRLGHFILHKILRLVVFFRIFFDKVNLNENT